MVSCSMRYSAMRPLCQGGAGAMRRAAAQRTAGRQRCRLRVMKRAYAALRRHQGGPRQGGPMHAVTETTEAQMLALATDPDPAVRARLAASSAIAGRWALMRQLVSDPDLQVRRALADNPVAPRVYSVPAFRSHPALVPERERVRR